MRRSEGRPFAALAMLLSAGLVLLVVATSGSDPALAPPPAASTSPWTCPMHPDILEPQQGSCPLCKMQLVPIRLDTVWSCPVHSVVMEEGAGRCPLCRRDLVKMPVAVSWTCANRPDIQALDPGTCPDGTPMVIRRALRPHGNHSPQHGGQFFMAADNWHHVEGTHPQPRLFQLHVYDDYSRPVTGADVRHITGRIVTHEQFDPATRTTRELTVHSLTLSRDGATLEAPLDDAPLPREITAKVRFKDGGPEFRFDFTFQALSTPTGTVGDRSAATTVPAVATLAVPPLTAAAAPAPAPADETVSALLAELRQLDGAIGDHIANGAFEDVYRPAFAAKELALTLGEHPARLPPRARERAAGAIATLVLMAWRLDAFGDLGNRQLLLDADAQFGAALDEIERLFSSYGATTSSATGTGASMRVPTASVTGVASQ